MNTKWWEMKIKKKIKKLLERLEFMLFIFFLKRHCDATDQWDLMQVKAKGDTKWFITVSLIPDPGFESNYRKID